MKPLPEEYFVSIIIPAHNEERTIGSVLDKVISQNYTKKEIIVIDDNSNDSTPEICRKYKEINYTRNKKNLGLAKTLNKGIRLAGGDIIVTLHADVVPVDENWLANLIELFGILNVGVVKSLVLDKDVDRLPVTTKLFVRMYNSGWKYEGESTWKEIEFADNKADGYLKKALDEVGGFDEGYSRYSAGEDIDLSFRIKQRGYKILLNPDAKAYHLMSSHQRHLFNHLRKVISYSAVDPMLYIRHRYCFRMPYFLSMGLVSISIMLEYLNALYLIWVFSIIFILIDTRVSRHFVFGFSFAIPLYILLHPSVGIQMYSAYIFLGFVIYYIFAGISTSVELWKKTTDRKILFFGPLVFSILPFLAVYGFTKGLIHLLLSSFRSDNNEKY